MFNYEIVNILSLAENVEEFIVGEGIKFHLINKSKFKGKISSLNSLNTAKLLASILINENWNLKFFNSPKLFKFNNKFYIFKFKNGKIIHLGIYGNFETAEKRLIKIFKSHNVENHNKHISHSNNRFSIQKSIGGRTRSFGRFDSRDVAVFVRDKLMENDWKVSFFKKNPRLEFNEDVLSFKVVNDRIKLVDNVDKSANERSSEGKWGKYISRPNDTFYIQKSINKRSRSFGGFDSQDVAVFVRDRLVENNWKISSFKRSVFLVGDEYWAFDVNNNKVVFMGKFGFSGEVKSPSSNDCGGTGFKLPNKDSYVYLYCGDQWQVSKSIEGKNAVFGRFANKDIAVFVRDRLVENNWKISSFKRSVFLVGDEYWAFDMNKNNVVFVGKFGFSDDVGSSSSNNDIKNESKLPHKTSYVYPYCGDQWQVSKSIRGKNTVFGRFDSRDVAVFVRDKLMENDWKVSFFRKNPRLEFNGGILSFEVNKKRIELSGQEIEGKVISYLTSSVRPRKNNFEVIVSNKDNNSIKVCGTFEDEKIAKLVSNELNDNGCDIKYFKNKIIEFDSQYLNFDVENNKIRLLDIIHLC